RGPQGNRSGVTFLTQELEARRLEVLRERVPGAVRVAVLVTPANAVLADTSLRHVEAAARAMGLQIRVFNASTSREIDAIFATFVRERPDVFFAGGDPLWASRRGPPAILSARPLVPSPSPPPAIA